MQIQQQIDLMVKFGITEKQLLFLNIHYGFSINEQYNNTDKLIDLIGVISLKGNKVMCSREERTDLVDKKLIRVNANNSYSITSLFSNEVHNAKLLIQDIYDIYPDFALIKGANIPLKIGNKYELDKVYNKNIRSSKLEHLEILKDIEFANSNKSISVNIKNFIESELYVSYRKLRIDTNTNSIFHQQDDL